MDGIRDSYIKKDKTAKLGARYETNRIKTNTHKTAVPKLWWDT